MHTAKVEKRTYRVPGGGKRILTGVLLFVSCLLILSGLLRDNSGSLKVEVKVTPTPTVIGRAFDETMTTRQVTLPQKSWFAIQLGAFDSEASAKALADSYISRGAAGYVLKDSRFRVLAALYPSKEDAQTVRQQLQTQHKIESYVYEISLPEIILNVEGMAGQLDALEAGMQYLNTTLEKFCQSSVSMDRQDLSVEQELTKLAEIASQAETLANVLTIRFTSVKSTVVDNLVRQLEEVIKATKAVAEASQSGTVAMAAQMKYQTLALLNTIRNFLSTFSQ